jgi:hypothetical protein
MLTINKLKKKTYGSWIKQLEIDDRKKDKLQKNDLELEYMFQKRKTRWLQSKVDQF